MKKSFIIWIPVSLAVFFFNGCATYYATAAPEEHSDIRINKQVPVKVELKQTGSSIVVQLPDEDIRKNVSDVLFDNPIFVEDESSSKILKIDIRHSNAGAGAELGNALLTGASLYLIPGVTDSVVDIGVSLDGKSSNYQGELVAVQGLGASSMIDKTKYTEDAPLNLMKDLIKNAIDEFTVVYLKKQK